MVEMSAPLEIGFCVSDLNRSLTFWRDTLQLSFISDIWTPESAARSSGIGRTAYRVVRLQLPTGERIKLFAPAEAAGQRPETPLHTPLSQPGFAFVTLIVKSMSETLSTLNGAGISPRHPPYELRAGVTVALVDDPDGNIVELVEYVNVAEYRSKCTAVATNP